MTHTSTLPYSTLPYTSHPRYNRYLPTYLPPRTRPPSDPDQTSTTKPPDHLRANAHCHKKRNTQHLSIRRRRAYGVSAHCIRLECGVAWCARSSSDIAPARTLLCFVWRGIEYEGVRYLRSARETAKTRRVSVCVGVG